MKLFKRIRFGLPKIYTGEPCVEIIPFGLHMNDGEGQKFGINSQVNIGGFFLWQLYFESGWCFNLIVCGFELIIDLD